MTEEWRPISDYEGLYLISSEGQVKSLGRRVGRLVKMPKTLKPSLTAKGYLKVDLVNAEGQRTSRRLHRLVALAFHGEPKPGQEVRHLNGVRTDNRAANLAWGTGSENTFDAVRHGTHVNASKTHCIHGHPLSGENLHVKDGKRQCRTCDRIRDRSRKRRH